VQRATVGSPLGESLGSRLAGLEFAVSSGRLKIVTPLRRPLRGPRRPRSGLGYSYAATSWLVWVCEAGMCTSYAATSHGNTRLVGLPESVLD
jgi:hypothetical protein